MPGSEEPAERREVTFSGRVQGVGFRYTARRMAAREPVSGFVKNLADGRVFLVAEGEPSTLDRLLGALEAEMGRYIDAKQVATRPATGEFHGFEVQF